MEEVYALDLDEELLSHLPDIDSWLVIRGEGLKPELIEDDFVREVFEWQDGHVREHGKPATASVLADQFELEFADPLTAVGDLIERMRERYMNNQGRKSLAKIGETYKQDPLATPKLLIKEGQRLNNLLARRGETYGTGDFDRALYKYHEQVNNKTGASLGFPELDDYFFEQRGLTILVAPPKTWKSWYMIQTLYANIAKGLNVYLYSLELPADESKFRLNCLTADVPWWKYLRNSLTREEIERMREGSELLDGCGVHRIVKPPIGERDINSLVEKARDDGADLVLIDQLQYVEGKDGMPLGEANDPGQYWGMLQRARDLSDDGPICFAHQFNRSTMFCDEMPVIQQAKGSSAIEETATLALGMFANKDMRRNNVVEVGTLISRNYNFQSWEMGVELSRGCNFGIIGKVEDDG